METDEFREHIKGLIKSKNYRNAIDDSGTLLESCMKTIYKNFLISISPEEKSELIKKEAEISKGKSINQLMLGQLISLFSSGGIFKKYATIKQKGTRFFNHSLFNQINEIRIKCTHDDGTNTFYESNEEEANFVFASICNIISELGLDTEESNNQLIIPEKSVWLDNLPRPEYIEFIGRENDIAEVLKQLKGRSYIISIGGIGGVGKSALALESAKKCKEEGIFDLIVWLSAKQKRLDILGIADIVPQVTSFEDVLNKILNELGVEGYDKYKVEAKKKMLYDLLKGRKVLLVVDNFETIEDKEIFNFLKDLPEPTKALVTTRKAVGEVERIITLEPFCPAETEKMLSVELTSKSYPALSKEDTQKIHESTGGIPLAIKIIVGWLVQGKSVNSITEKMKKGDETKILDFCFNETYNTLLSPEAKLVFCTMTTIPFEWATEKQIEVTSNVAGDGLRDALSQLVQLSLLNRKIMNDTSGVSEIYYNMLPLTAAYAYNKLTENRGMENDARRRFARHMELNMRTQDALKQYGMAWGEMGGQTENGRAAAMLANIAFATFQRGNYHAAIKLFKQAIEADPALSYVYQLWATVERQTGNTRIAEELFSQAATLNPKNPVIWQSWAMMRKEVGDLVGAKGLLERAKRAGASSPILLQQLGVIVSMLGEYKDAINILVGNLNIAPKTAKDRVINTSFMTAIAETYFKWGDALSKAKNYKSAEACFSAGLEQVNKHLDIVFKDNYKLIQREKRLYRALGILKRNSKKYTEATVLFERALFKPPRDEYQFNHNKMVSLDVAVMLKFTGKTDELRLFCNECFKKYNDDNFLNLLK